MNKRLAIALILFASIVLGTVIYFRGKRYEVVIEQTQIDAALAKKFPLAKKYLLIFEITYSNPQVELLEKDDRIRVALDANLDLRIGGERKSLGGSCSITSGMRFDPATQEFFLADARFERLEIQGIPENYLNQVTEFASKAAKEFVETQPIYRLKAKDSKTAAAKLLLKDVDVKNQAVHVTLGL